MDSTNLIRRMNFFQMIGALAKIYKKSFVPLSLITLFNVVISFVLLGVYNSTGNEILLILFLYSPILYAGPILVAISNTVLGQKVKVFESFRKGLSFGLLFKTILVALPFAAITFFLTGMVAVSMYEGVFIVFYLIFFILMPAWVFFPMISLVEKKGFFRAIGRSLKFFFLNFLRNFLILIACLIFAIPFYLLGIILDQMLGNLVEDIVYSQMDAAILYAIPFITMFALSFYVMSYYEIRARRENYSADILSQELGFAPLEEMMSI